MKLDEVPETSRSTRRKCDSIHDRKRGNLLSITRRTLDFSTPSSAITARDNFLRSAFGRRKTPNIRAGFPPKLLSE
jgi:hypothetical protein